MLMWKEPVKTKGATPRPYIMGYSKDVLLFRAYYKAGTEQLVLHSYLPTGKSPDSNIHNCLGFGDARRRGNELYKLWLEKAGLKYE